MKWFESFVILCFRLGSGSWLIPLCQGFVWGRSYGAFIGKEGLSDGLLARLSELGFNNGALTDAAFDGHWDALNFVRVLSRPGDTEAEMDEWSLSLGDWQTDFQKWIRMGRKRMAADIPLGAVTAKAMYLKDSKDAALSHLLTVLEKDLVKLHWRTKASRVLSNSKTDEERQRAESDELHKWQAGLTEIFERGGLPIVAQASTAADPAGALVGGPRLLGTASEPGGRFVNGFSR